MTAFDPDEFQRKLAVALGAGAFDAAAFERKLADALGVNAQQWQATIARDPATKRTTSMLLTPASSGTPILITPAFDSEGLMTAATIAPLRLRNPE